MSLNLKEILLENAPIKAVSFILGCTLWSLLGQFYTIQRSITVPLCFYSLSDKLNVKAPETVKVILAGKRSTLRHLDLANVAVHIDGSEIKEGPNSISVTRENLFLPQSIKLVDYCPSNIIVTAHTQ